MVVVVVVLLVVLGGFGAGFDVVKGFALLPDEYTAGPELGAAGDIGALYVDWETGAGAGLKLGELITTGRRVVVVVVVVVLLVVLGGRV